MSRYNEIAEKLHLDYLDLWESYQNDLCVQEFGFRMIVEVTKMIFDCAPNEMVARETIRISVEEGYQMHYQSQQHQE